MDTLFVSIFIILAGGTAALFLSNRFILMQRVVIGATALGSAAGLCFTLTHLLGNIPVKTASWTWLHIFDLSFTEDSVSLFFLIPVFLIPPLALLYSLEYFSDDGKKGEGNTFRIAVNYFFTALLVVSMALVVTASNMISFALAWEIMSIASFFLILFDYQDKEKRKAGYLYLIFVQGGAMFLFAAFALIYRHTGSFDFAAVSAMPESGKLAVFLLAL
ncbi:MAG: hydrogenase, partial [Candidatus Electrothrix sp. ATG2]|nr:hydrogenase [Candidatus Electrothrix sp. ATG2]